MARLVGKEAFSGLACGSHGQPLNRYALVSSIARPTYLSVHVLCTVVTLGIRLLAGPGLFEQELDKEPTEDGLTVC